MEARQRLNGRTARATPVKIIADPARKGFGGARIALERTGEPTKKVRVAAVTHTEADIDKLLRDVAALDRAAFRHIYRLASAKLFGIALRICRDRHVAEEALQDTFLDIWRTAGKFDPGRGSGMAWMSVIARNRAIDVLRRRGRDAQRSVADGEDLLPHLPDPRAVTDGGVEHMALAACLEELDKTARDMVLRAYYLGETREDLAARFDAPVNTIKTWLRRGLQSLKGCLDR